jgi:hypothetical protein
MQGRKGLHTTRTLDCIWYVKSGAAIPQSWACKCDCVRGTTPSTPIPPTHQFSHTPSPVTHFFPFLLQASATPIAGPQVLRPLVNHCYLFKNTNGPTFEFCGFKSVRQIFSKPAPRSYFMGYYKGWVSAPAPKTDSSGGGGGGGGGGGAAASTATVQVQQYTGGDTCEGFGDRQTLIYFKCKESAETPEYVGIKEDYPCKYEMTIATKLWCAAEDDGGGAIDGSGATPAPSPGARMLLPLAMPVAMPEGEEEEETSSGRSSSSSSSSGNLRMQH